MKPALLATLLLTTACLNPVVNAADAKPAPDRKIVFKTIGDVSLSLHVFEPPADQTTTPRPAIVFFFGGGWVGGSPSQFYGQSRAIADRGMVAICAEYRVRKTHGTSPKECVADGKSAIRYVRKHAAELGIDPNRIAAGGGSAGGHVAAATAMVADFDDPNDDPTISCRPDALVLFNPVFDNGPDGYGYDRVKDYWQAISPLHRLNKQSPPTIVFLGTKDKLIPASTGKAYAAKMKELGVRCDLHLYEGEGHGFFNKGDAYEDTQAKTIAFLESLGYLS
ncbi:alpha/beta hydrolase [Stieleria sp. TO1_6]|uniref:alpha/beta hydrolase n=1 Tax=Stieleria tagensis TaxID=2956795 RepID=UPI00209B7C74|nr:alpha/beta hydrolase fold domain-containing protein [Stieleria tagensis]MCO8125319.1 alpha/beta hydrolase [Stieleria tagensis]